MAFYIEGVYYILLGVIWVIALALLRLKFRHSWPHLFFLTVMYIYLWGVIKMTQFPLMFIPDGISNQAILDRVNWIPFNHIMYDLKNSALNIILTFPFGFLLPFVKKKVTPKIILLWSILLPLLLEGTQLIMSLVTHQGMRIIDVNDIITNFLGIWVGYGVYKVFIRIFRWLADKEKVEHDAFTSYIYNRT